MSKIDPPVLASVLQPLSPLVLQLRRVTGGVVGRAAELTAIHQEIASAGSGQLSTLTVEGEPGIGKTRLLLSAAEAASASGFATIVVAADEEIRGPFLLARQIFGSPDAAQVAAGTPAAEPLAHSLDILSGRDDPTLGTLPADQKLLRAFDLGAVALRAIAAQRPLALLIDDLQWADDDSLRLLRYAIRAAPASPIFLMATIRPEELALVTEAVNLIADMERLGLIRRLKVGRFTPVESTELLQQVLGGKMDPISAATVHRQAEGVPFVVEEIAHTYREAGMLQEIDTVWTLAKNAERLVPEAVRTLISRRAARLPDDTKDSLAEAAILGRRFSLKDLTEVQRRVRDVESSHGTLEDQLAPAVTAGLLVQHPESSAADYSFAHEQVRDFAASSLSPARQRAVHGAIVALLMAGEPSVESLPLLAQHARAAGDAAVCVRFALQATKNALEANAPEEVLRLVELALPAAATPQERVGLLQARDEALAALRRARDRLEGLAELAALADALGDEHLEFDVQLRRAAALRVSEEADAAAGIARRVRERAAASGDARTELAATLELGQDLFGAALGESFTPPDLDVDFDAAEEAFGRAAELAGQMGDDAALAAALRELGVLDFSRVRAWFVERIEQGEQFELARRVTTGESIGQLIAGTPNAALAERATERLQRALSLFEALGDRRGAMSSVIALAYLNWGADIHLGSGAARHIEEIRRLASRMQSFTKESERAKAEGQMLYGVHVFSLAKGISDLAVSRGEDAFRHARVTGDRSLEFLAAGGTAVARLQLGEVDGAREWVDRAASVASESPTPFRARQLETWRGMSRAAAGDAEGMRRHLERAVQFATEQGRPAARCETLARLALEAARMGAEANDEALLTLAETSAADAKRLMDVLPGHPPWGVQSDAALALCALARGAGPEAADHARSALGAIMAARQEDVHLDALLPIARVIMEAGSEQEQEMVRFQLGLLLAMMAMRTLDEDVRAKWFRGPVGREMSALVGPLESLDSPASAGAGVPLDEMDATLLRHVMQGLTNHEIAKELDVDEDEVRRRLGEMFARIGASSRAEATAFAFREQVM